MEPSFIALLSIQGRLRINLPYLVLPGLQIPRKDLIVVDF